MRYGRNSGRHLDVGTAFVWSQESAYSAGFHIPCDTLAIPYHWFKKKALTTMRDTAPIPFPLCSSCPLSFRFLSASFPLSLLFISSSSLLHFFFSFPVFHFLSSLPLPFLTQLCSSIIFIISTTCTHRPPPKKNDRSLDDLGCNPWEASVFCRIN